MAMLSDPRVRMPKTRAAQAKLLSDAAVAGYFSGFNDRDPNRWSDITPERRRQIRLRIRREISRWLGR